MVRATEIEPRLAPLVSKNYAGLYPLGNLVAPEKQLTQIRAVRATIGQESGTTSAKYGAPGGIRTRVAGSPRKLERPTYSRRHTP
jgi:hypothetical protein